MSLLVAAALLLLPLGRAVLAFRHEYAAFATANHEVARPEPEADLPAIQDLRIELPVGSPLAAWHVPSRNGAAIVLVHGSQGDRASLWPEARELARAGYGVLLIDLPGHGESPGKVDWGAGARSALSAAVTALLNQPGVDPSRVGALGFSMGAVTVAQVAASDARIRAVLLNGCHSDARRQTLYEFRQWGPITGWPALLAYRLAGFDDRDQRPVDVIGRIAPRPLLIVQGTDDGIVPASMARELYDAAGEPRALWMVPGAGHGDLLQVEPEQWPRQLRDFFDRALPPAGPAG